MILQAKKWMHICFWIWGFAGFMCVSSAMGAPFLNGFDMERHSIPLSEIKFGGPPRDGIPAIDHPRFITATQADLADDERILGLELGGVARAYPIRILNWHEIVNDQIGAQAIVVTYCPLCGTGMAFEATLPDGAAASFGVSGLLYNSDVLLYDRATHSLWSQLLRTAISGLWMGSRLTPLPLTHMRWREWHRRYPQTVVLSENTGYVRDYAQNPYLGYERSPELMFDVAHQDARFTNKEWVLGVEINGHFKAYPLRTLAHHVNPDGMLSDNISGNIIKVHYLPAQQSAEAFDAQGRLLPATLAYWFAWVAFHPDTEVLDEDRSD